MLAKELTLSRLLEKQIDRTTNGYDAHLSLLWLTSLRDALKKDKVYLQLFTEDGEEIVIK